MRGEFEHLPPSECLINHHAQVTLALLVSRPPSRREKMEQTESSSDWTGEEKAPRSWVKWKSNMKSNHPDTTWSDVLIDDLLYWHNGDSSRAIQTFTQSNPWEKNAIGIEC